MRIDKWKAPLAWFVFLLLSALCLSLASEAGISQTTLWESRGSDTLYRLSEWEYAWEEGPDSPYSSASAASGWTWVPWDDWKHTESLLNPEGREGSDKLWLRAKLPEDMTRDVNLLIQANQLFEVYAGGERIYNHGSIEPTGRSHCIGTPPRIVPLPDSAAGKFIYIRIYSFSKDIGLLQEPIVASRAAIFNDFIHKQAVRFILGSFYILVGFIALYPYYKLRQTHLISFAGFSAAFGLYTTTRTTLIYMIHENPVFWMVVELVSLMVSIASVLAFIEHLFGAGWRRHLKYIWQAHLLYGAVTIPLAMMHVLEVPTLLTAYQSFILFSMLAGIWRIGSTAYRGDRDARTVLQGMIVFCLCGAADIFRSMLAVESTLPELAYWGAFVFLISLIIVVIRRLILMLARLSNTEKLSVAGQLAAGVAHEIRNPITVISGYLQLMKKDASNRKVIEIMQGEVNRIQLIMNEFLFLAKPSEPKYDIHRMENILRDVLQLFRTQAATAGIAIHFRCPGGLPGIACDDNQLKQVYVNVIKNALEAMPDGGELCLTINVHNGEMEILAADTGCGIPEEELARIGEPFYTTKETGNGLGVMICRSIIENHKGRLVISSVAGAGTTVSIRLPLSRK
jgi:two-component system, sporulation sensor kinase E